MTCPNCERLERALRAIRDIDNPTSGSTLGGVLGSQGKVYMFQQIACAALAQDPNPTPSPCGVAGCGILHDEHGHLPPAGSEPALPQHPFWKPADLAEDFCMQLADRQPEAETCGQPESAHKP